MAYERGTIKVRPNLWSVAADKTPRIDLEHWIIVDTTEGAVKECDINRFSEAIIRVALKKQQWKVSQPTVVTCEAAKAVERLEELKELHEDLQLFVVVLAAHGSPIHEPIKAKAKDLQVASQSIVAANMLNVGEPKMSRFVTQMAAKTAEKENDVFSFEDLKKAMAEAESK